MEEGALTTTFFCLSVCFYTAELARYDWMSLFFLNNDSTLTLHHRCTRDFPTIFYQLACIASLSHLSDLTSSLIIYIY